MVFQSFGSQYDSAFKNRIAKKKEKKVDILIFVLFYLIWKAINIF